MRPWHGLAVAAVAHGPSMSRRTPARSCSRLWPICKSSQIFFAVGWDGIGPAFNESRFAFTSPYRGSMAAALSLSDTSNESSHQKHSLPTTLLHEQRNLSLPTPL